MDILEQAERVATQAQRTRHCDGCGKYHPEIYLEEHFDEDQNTYVVQCQWCKIEEE